MIITDIKATSNEAHFGKQIREGSQTKGETKKPSILIYNMKWYLFYTRTEFSVLNVTLTWLVKSIDKMSD